MKLILSLKDLRENSEFLDNKIKFKSIELKDVSFKYNEKAKLIFDKLNLKIKKISLVYKENLEVEKQL